MKTHYDVLKLDRSCTEKEIKESFIKLSKEYHPDKYRGSDAHEKFIKVNEAYSVLGKSGSRLKYDESLDRGPVANPFSHGVRSYPRYYTYVHYHRRGNHFDPKNPTLIRSKRKALLFCFMLMFLGSGLQLGQIWMYKQRRDLNSQRVAAALRHSRRRIQEMTVEQYLMEIGKTDAEKKPQQEE